MGVIWEQTQELGITIEPKLTCALHLLAGEFTQGDISLGLMQTS
jgi:hypothetical protein